VLIVEEGGLSLNLFGISYQISMDAARILHVLGSNPNTGCDGDGDEHEERERAAALEYCLCLVACTYRRRRGPSIDGN
jgi:hypothetical protein